MTQNIVHLYREKLRRGSLVKVVILAAIAMFLATTFITNTPAGAQSSSNSESAKNSADILASSSKTGKISEFEEELGRYRTAYSNAKDDKKEPIKKSYKDLENRIVSSLNSLKSSYSVEKEQEVANYLNRMEALLKDAKITIPEEDGGDIGVISPEPPGDGGGGGGDDGDGEEGGGDDGDEEDGKGTWTYDNPDRGPTTKYSKYNHPKAYVAWAKESNTFSQACEFLTFCRWWNATMFPTPDSQLTNIGQVATVISGSISFLALHTVTVLALIFGWALGMASSLQIFDRLMYVMDGIFADMGKVIFLQNTTGGDIPLFIIILLWGVGISLIWLIASRFRLVKHSQIDARIARRKIFWTIGVLAFIGFSSYQAQFNHPDKTNEDSKIYPIAWEYHSKTNSDDDEVVGRKIMSDDFSLSNAVSDWSPASPGWFISLVNYGADVLGQAAGKTLATVSGAVSYTLLGDDKAEKVANTTECDAYVTGMHDLFRETQYSQSSFYKSNEVLLSYDNVIKELHFDSYRLATFGQNEASGATWCRSAELQTNRTASEQVAISRVAGLYPDAIGWGRLGLDDDKYPLVGKPPESRGSVDGEQKHEGYFITEDGEWREGDVPGEWLANGVFGPTFTHPRGGDSSLYMFGACENHIGQEMALREDWGMVVKADSKDELLTVNDCSQGFGSDQDKAVGTEGDPPEDNKGAESDDDGFVDAIKNAGQKVIDTIKDPVGSVSNWFSGNGYGVTASNGLNAFNYSSSNGKSPLFSGLGGIAASESSVKFSQSQYAYDFFRTAQGADPGSTAFFAVNSLVAVIFFAKYFAGLLMGGLGSEVLASVMSMFIFIILLFTAIPIERTRSIGKTAGMVYIYAAVASTLALVIIQAALIMSDLFKVLTTGVFGGIPLLSQVVTAVSVIMGFWVTNKLLNIIFPNGEFDGFRNQLNTMGGTLGYPILHAAGINAPNILSREFWRRDKSDPRHEDSDAKTDAPNSSGSRFGDPLNTGSGGVHNRANGQGPDRSSQSSNKKGLDAPESEKGKGKSRGKRLLNEGARLAANQGLDSAQRKSQEKFGTDADGNQNLVGEGIDGIGNFLRGKINPDDPERQRKYDHDRAVNVMSNASPSQYVDEDGNVVSGPSVSQNNAFGTDWVASPDGTILTPKGNVSDDSTSGLFPSRRTSRMEQQDVQGDLERIDSEVLNVRPNSPSGSDSPSGSVQSRDSSSRTGDYINRASTADWDIRASNPQENGLNFISRGISESESPRASAPMPPQSRQALDEIKSSYQSAHGSELNNDKEAVAYASGAMGIGTLGLSGMTHLVEQGRAADAQTAERISDAVSNVGNDVYRGTLRAFQSQEYANAHEYITAQAIDKNYNPNGIFPEPVWERAEGLREWMDSNDTSIHDRENWPMEQREAFTSIANDMREVFNITESGISDGNVGTFQEPHGISREFTEAIDGIFARDYAKK